MPPDKEKMARPDRTTWDNDLSSQSVMATQFLTREPIKTHHRTEEAQVRLVALDILSISANQYRAGLCRISRYR